MSRVIIVITVLALTPYFVFGTISPYPQPATIDIVIEIIKMIIRTGLVVFCSIVFVSLILFIASLIVKNENRKNSLKVASKIDAFVSVIMFVIVAILFAVLFILK